MRKFRLSTMTWLAMLLVSATTSAFSAKVGTFCGKGISMPDNPPKNKASISSISWTEVRPAGDTDNNWTCSAISADGSKIIAGTNGKLYLSSDGGNSWTEALPYTNSQDKYWSCVAISGDGSTLLAGTLGEYLFISADSGQTWNIAGAADYGWTIWTSVAVSGDGTYLLAADGTYLYISQNKNETWSFVDGENNSRVSVSSDGNYMAATKYDDYGIFKLSSSTNYGNNWNTIDLGNSHWNAVSVSADGQTSLAASGRLYLTTNTGATWDETQPWSNMDYGWSSVSVSGDGLKMIAAIENDPIFFSTDGGVNWSETQPRGSGYYDWMTVAVSADGSTLLAGHYNGRLYKGTFSGPPATEFSGIPVFSSITSNSANTTGNITSTNGADATNVGGIIYEYTNTDKSIGDAGVTQEDSTGTFGTGEFPVSFTGLSANTRYNARVYATNPSGTGYSSRDAFWTLANVPSAPTVNNPAATTLDVAVNVNGNPSGTEFVIHETTQNKYVQADGTLGASAVWQTAATWGTKTVTGLTTGTTYTFEVKARNGGNTETAYGLSASGMPMAAPTVTIPESVWAETQPAGNLNKVWSSNAISADGSVMLASSTSRIYRYENNWNEIYPPGGTASNKNWKSVALSADGSRMLAAVIGGRIYMFSNGAWAETLPTGIAEDKSWQSVAVSADGNTMLAAWSAFPNGKIYMYTNNTWNEIYPPGGAISNKIWQSLSVSADGSKMLAAVNGGRIYLFSNGAWAEIQPAGNYSKSWQSVSISADGTKMLAAVRGGRIYKYDNGWTEIYPPGGTNADNLWKAVSVSADGSKMLAAVEDGRNYLYSNGAWAETQPAGNVSKAWSSVSVSSDGTTMLSGIAGGTGGRLYLSQTPPFNISTSSAICYGNISSTNGVEATSRGIIYYPFTNTDKIIGDAGVENESESGNYSIGEFSKSLNGLSVNSHYNFRAYASNSVGAGYSARSEFWTLANVPFAPTVDNPTATTLDITIDANGNPDSTLFAIQDSINSTYVQADGSLAATTVWKTATAWGTKTITGLTTGTAYYFRVKAKNGEGVETAFGDTASAIPTSKPALAWKVVETVWDSTASEKLWWADVDVSGNGQNMIACSSYGRVYKTADGADTWLETQPTGDNDTFWYKVAVSGNGQVMMAAELEDFLYKSDDGGTTWSEVQPAGEEWDCTALSLSDDGTALLAGLGNERLYLSIDSGENWNEVLPGGDNDFYWSSTGISDDGNTMIAAADNGRIYLSFNRGADWIETRPMGDNDLNWYAVAVSGDGQTMMAALQYGRIYKSVDAGNTWNEIQPADNNDYDWSGVSVSFDGQIMYACNANNNHIYESADGGNTWTELMAGRDWVSVAVSSDGSTALAAATEDYLYKGKLIVFDSISETTAHATAKIVSTNGADATNRGVIYYPYTNTDKSIGDAGVTQEDSTGTFGTGEFPVSFTGLSANTRYNARVYASNPSGTGYSLRDAFWTLANVPETPTLNNVTATTLDITIDANGNPDSTLFAIQDSINGTYVQADGSLAATTVWKTATAWGTKTITGLTAGNTYYFRVKAKNGGGTETAFGISASGMPMAAPTVDYPTVGGSWTETQPNGDSNYYWYTVSTSFDGSKMLAGQQNGRLYLSINGGSSWSETQPVGSGDAAWISSAVSSDGNTLVATVDNGRMYKSTSNGTSWSEIGPTPLSDKYWTSVSISSDGSKMLAGVTNYGKLYSSGNGGVTWNEGNIVQHWSSVSISSDGNKMIAAAHFGRIYLSVNGGADWSEIGPVPYEAKDWQAVSISGDGNTMLAAVYDGRLYKSTDGGVTWAETMPAGPNNRNWDYVSISEDGAKMLAGISWGRLYISTDYGATWSETGPAPFINRPWESLAVSGNGIKMIACENGQRIYTRIPFTITNISPTSATGNGSIASLNGGGDATTRGCIYYSYTGTNKIIGDTDVTNVSTNGIFSTGDFTASLTGLSVNNRYNLRAHATNTVGTGYSARCDFWTLANVPGTPTLNNPTATTLDITIDANGNPDSTLFAIQDSINSTYVQADGSLAATTVWKTATAWGTKTITGLTTGTAYYFRVKAKNGEGVETAFGDTASAIPTSKPALAWKVVETVWDSTASEKRWWMDVDVAANGQDMLACVIFGRLFHSADRGATWTEIQPDGDKDKKWNKVAMSGDGQIMLAGEQNGRLYQSSDGGNSWTEQQPAGNTNQDWGLLSISSDGNTILAGSGGLRLYLSTNAGQAWNEIQPGGDSDYHWYSAAVSEDGQILLAAVKNGRIYRSFDQGSTWAEVQPIDNDDHNWKAVSVSGNGQYMMAGEFTGRIYQSGDYGNKWTETQPLGDNDAYWETLSMSFDGQARYSTYSDPDGALFESPDRGENWTRLFDNLEWTVAAVSSDASTVLAGSFLDRLYCGRTVIFDSITTTTALGTATIASTNGGNVTNRGAFYYLYSDTGKQIGDASVVNTDTTGTFPAGEYPVTFTGLSVNTHYNARAHATNYKGTGYSYRTGFWTLANVPSAPTVDNPTATTLDVAVNVNGNPNATEFVIHETSTDKFIQADGTLGATAVWATATTWGTKTVTGLTTGTEYTFEVKARNGANVETDYGTSTSQSTCSNPTNGGSIGSDQTICSGSTPVAFTSNSSPSNYAGTLEYKWQVSTTSELTGFTDISASNSLTYSPGALTMDSWYKRLARVSCKTDWTGAAETNVVKITIRPTFTAGTILTTGETICYIGDPAEIGSTTAASGGDGNIEYKWQADGSDIAGSNSATYNPPSGLTTTTVYTRWAKDGTCNAFEESTGSWTVTVDPTSVGGSVTGGTTICSGNTSALLTLSGHTGNVIKWQYSLDGITWTDIVHTGTTYTSGILTDTTQFRAVVLSGVCIEAYSTPTTVVVQYPVAVASVDIWCTGSPIGAIAYHAFPHNGGTPSYQWYKNGSPVGTNSPDYTNQAVAGDTVYVIMQSSLTCVAPVQSEGKCTVAH